MISRLVPSFMPGSGGQSFIKESRFYANDTHMHRIDIDVSSRQFTCAEYLALNFDHASARSSMRTSCCFRVPVDLKLLENLKKRAGEANKIRISISKDVFGDHFKVTYINQRAGSFFSRPVVDGKTTLFFRTTPLLNERTGKSCYVLLPENHTALQCLQMMGSQLNHTDVTSEDAEQELQMPPVYTNDGITADEVTFSAVNYINQALISR